MNIVKDAHRVVVKVGSSTLTHEWRELKLKRDTVRRSFHLP